MSLYYKAKNVLDLRMRNTEYNGYFFNEDGQVFNEKGLLLRPHLENSILKTIQKKKRIVLKDVIAKLFIPNPMNHKFTQTIDGDPTNVSKDNIEWVAYPKKTKHKSCLLYTSPSPRDS